MSDNSKIGHEDLNIQGYFWNGDAMEMKVGVPLKDLPNIPSLKEITDQMKSQD